MTRTPCKDLSLSNTTTIYNEYTTIIITAFCVLLNVLFSTCMDPRRELLYIKITLRSCYLQWKMLVQDPKYTRIACTTPQNHSQTTHTVVVRD